MSKKKNYSKGPKRINSYQYSMLCVIGVLAFFLIWQILVEYKIVSTQYLVKPSKVFSTFIYKLSNKPPDGSTLQENIIASLYVALSGFLVATVIGIPLGLLMGWYRPIDKFIRPVFEIIRPVPPVAWIPMSILWLGIGLKAKAIIIFFSAFVPCVINSYTGIRLTNQTLINVAKTFGASDFYIFRKVGIPSALPMVFAGIRIALGNSWSTLVAAEMLAANAGLGFMIIMGRQFARPDIIILGMMVIGAIGAVLSTVLARFEKNLVRWRVAR